jgi:cysteine-rich repeat protein
MRTLTAPALTLALAGFVTAACTSVPPDEELAQAVKRQLSTDKHDADLEFRLYQLEDAALQGEVTAASCDAVDEELATVCAELYAEGQVSSCSYTTSFFYANTVPRCAVRFETYPPSGSDASLSAVHVLDFAGTPIFDALPTCGDGVLDMGEACDDGNHEQWDGCDSNCAQEEFQGCEAVIEDLFADAGLARVRASDWDGPRSHLMVNHSAKSLRPLDAETCNDAIETATAACNELTTQMPFVSWCAPAGVFHEEHGAPACSIRLQVWFQQLDSNFGVFTTSLPGILAFTIR